MSNMSDSPLLVSFAARSLASLVNATKRPSALITGPPESLLPDPVPNRLTLTKVVVPICRSRTNTSVVPLVSFATKSLAVAEECHETAIRADHGDTRIAIARPRSKPVDAHQSRRPHLQIPHEHVSRTVGVVRHQVARIAGERHETAVRADRRDQPNCYCQTPFQTG